MDKNILITVCARGGSKSIPNKNIFLVNGKHLIGYTIEQAFRVADELNATVMLSTDSAEIRRISEQYGLSTNYERPDYLASDTAGKIDVLYDAIKHYESTQNKTCTHLIDLDVSSPMRTVEDVVETYKMLNENNDALNIFTVSEARKNPYFNMVERNEDGFVSLSKKAETFFTRQSAKEVLELNASIYVYKKAFFDQGCKSAITDKSLAYKMDHVCFDIDNEMELMYFEYLLKENKLKFEV